MPRPRKFRPRRRRRNWGRHVKTGLSVASTATRALALGLSLKKMLNVEHKFIDVFTPTPGLATAGLVNPLSLSVQGDTETTRNGDKIKAAFLSIKMLLIPAGAASNNQAVRIIVFKDKVSNGALPTAASLLQDTSASINQAMSHYNPDNCPSRYHIYFDKFCDAPAQATGQADPQIFHVNIPLSHHITYKGNAGTIADANTGHLYLYAQVNDITGAACNLYWYSRLSFVDN